MRITRQKLFINLIIAIFALFPLTMEIYPLICFNGSGDVYKPGDGGESMRMSRTVSIESLVELGAGYFLDGQSRILKFSRMVEMSNHEGIDGNGWNEILQQALTDISKARATYARLIEAADATPYNWDTIYKLWFFDYYGFMQEKGLNRDIFRQVRDYLSCGDVTGIYRHMYARLGTVEKMLTDLNSQVTTKGMPTVSDIWDLNEQCYSLHVFGQYVARVFYAVK
ncbi:MAG: hypothetical protein GY765_22895 [bacterium]|nr:hypothetical protein [bacterium]